MTRLVRLLPLVLLTACPPAVTEELRLNPSTLSLSVGETRQLTARVFAGNTPGEATGASWSSSNRDVVTVSSTGDGSATLTGIAEGTVTITARLRSLTATMELTVTPRVLTLTRIDVTPPNPTVANGLELQLAATGVFNDATFQDLTARATWASANESIATIDASGKVKGQGIGTVELTATSGMIIGRVTLRVTNAVLQSLQIEPPNITLALGTRSQLHAMGIFSDQTQLEVTQQVTWSSSSSGVASVNASGEARALSVGVTTISASLNGVSSQSSLSVTDAVLSSLSVTPPTNMLARGTSVNLVARGTFSDGTTQDLSTQVTWSSDAMSVASVSSAGVLTALSIGSATITASSGTNSATATVTVTPATLAMIQVTPPNAMLALGLTRAFTATGVFTDTSTQDLTAQVLWNSTAPAVAPVSNAMSTHGVVTGATVGTTTITATLGTVTGQTTLQVTAAALIGLSVTPANPSLVKGLTQQFTARGTFSDTTTQDVTTQVTWMTGTSTVASISNSPGAAGLLTALGVGTSTVIASLSGVTGNANVTVTPAVLQRIDVAPTVVMLPKGRTLQLTATGVFTDATTIDLTSQAMWNSATPFVASVSGGLLSALNPGNATITARAMSLVGSRPITVTAAVVESITIAPNPISLAKGLTLPLTATATFSDTTSMNVTTQVTWLSDALASLDVSNASGSQGLATALVIGSGNVSATLQGVTGSSAFNVTAPTLISFVVSPAMVSVPKGRTQQFTAMGTFSDLSMMDVTSQLTWTSTSPLVATVGGATGLASTLLVGNTTIEARQGMLLSSGALSVIPPVLDHLDVTPTTVTKPKGLTQQFTAMGVNTDGSQNDLTSTATWASSNGTAVGVTSTGLATANAVGTSDISATLGGISGSSPFTVTPAVLATITVTPGSPSIAKGRTQAFTATGTLTDATVQDLTLSATWGSTDMLVSTVTSGGVASALTVGTSSISATSGSVSGATTLTVTPAVVENLVLTGRSFVPVGGSVKLVATATFSDATVSDVSALATWASDAPTNARAQTLLGARGVVNGLLAGSANISATFGSANATMAVKVRDVNAPYTGRCSTGLVISQLFGGGGNAGAPFRNDFVELHNAGVTPRSLNGMSIQYTSAAGTAWASNNKSLPNVTIEPGGYFLVQLNVNGTVGSQITADFTTATQLDISASNGKIALVSSTVGMPANICPDAAVTVDFIGYGTANCSEGTVAPALSNTTSLLRGAGACRDANVNLSDLTAGTPSPRSAATPGILCSCAVNETDLVEEEQYCNLQFPMTLSHTQGTLSDTIFSRVFHAGLTEPAGADSSIVVEFGFGPSAANPLTTSTWSWWPGSFNVQSGNDDEYQGAFIVPAAPATYDFTARTTRDGVNWTYCDGNGAGMNAGLTFDPAGLGALTSTP